MRSAPPWYRAEWLMWLAVAALLASLAASWYGYKVFGSELAWGSILRVAAGLITVGRTIARKESGDEA